MIGALFLAKNCEYLRILAAHRDGIGYNVLLCNELVLCTISVHFMDFLWV